ncbi:MAG: hypothetical protein R6U68_00035 [Desulfobacteraceae bacterium]
MDDSQIKAAFFGKVTASVTHELQNILAIISENEALMEDVLMMHQDCSPETEQLIEQLAKSLESIKTQIARGRQRTSELNTFAHNPDFAKATFDMIEKIENLVSITRRITALSEVRVEIADNQENQTLETDAVFFQAAVFICIEMLTCNAFPGTVLTISLEKNKNRPAVQIKGSNPGNAQVFKNELSTLCTKKSSLWEKCTLVCGKTGFRISVLKDHSGIELIYC